MEHAASIAAVLGESADTVWMKSEAAALRSAILDSVIAVMGPKPAFIPGAVENTTDSAMARGTVPALWPTELFPETWSCSLAHLILIIACGCNLTMAASAIWAASSGLTADYNSPTRTSGSAVRMCSTRY